MGMQIPEKGRISEEIEKRQQECVNLCCEIISRPSENPPGDTSLLAGYIRDKLTDIGLSVQTYEPKRNNPNIVSIRKGEGEKPNLVLNGHMDYFPASGSKLWDVEPFSGSVKDGKILGCGVGDMKGGLAALLSSFLLINELDIPLKGTLTLTFVSDEETGGKWGTEWLVNNVPNVRGDALLSGEASTPDAVRIGEKGKLWFRLKTYAKPGYGGGRGLEDNAIMKMCRALGNMKKLRGIRGETPEELKETVHDTKAFYRKEPPGAATAPSWVIDSSSVNIGLIKGGTKINVNPSCCEAEVDVRVPIGLATDEMQSKLRGITEASDVECELINVSSPNYTSPNERIVKLLRKNAFSITKREPISNICFGATDCRFYRYKGIPAVTYGPRSYNVAAPNEHILVRDYLTVIKVLSNTIIEYVS